MGNPSTTIRLISWDNRRQNLNWLGRAQKELPQLHVEMLEFGPGLLTCAII